MNANDRQIDGDHYTAQYQTWDFITEVLQNRYLEGNVARYVSRYRKKDGKIDLEKTGHYLQKLVEEARRGHIFGFAVVSGPDWIWRDRQIRLFAKTYSLTEAERELIVALADWHDIGDLIQDVIPRFEKVMKAAYPS